LSQSQDVLYIIIPAYNEHENLNGVINDWYPIVEKYDGNGQSKLIIIDDGSTDNTYELLQEAAKNRPQFIPMTKENGGHGSTVLYGYRYAIEQGADYIFQTDSDGQTNPDEFHEFWENKNSYDAVLGVRKTRQDGLSRKLVGNTLRFILRLIFGVKIPDANAPFRLMKSELVNKYIGKMPSDYNLPNAMLNTYFAYFNENIKFIEVSFKPRQGGKNSINIKKIIGIGIKAVGDFRYLKRTIDD